MEITIRETCGYVDVKIKSENIVIDFGFHGKKEAAELLEVLKMACNDLESYLGQS